MARNKAGGRLRQHLEACLAEVAVEGKGPGKAQVLHDNEAGAIGEGIALVPVGFEIGPGPFPDLPRYFQHSYDPAAEERVSKLHRCSVADLQPQHGNRFVKDVIGGEQDGGLEGETLPHGQSLCMSGVGSVMDRHPPRSVHEQFHSFLPFLFLFSFRSFIGP